MRLTIDTETDTYEQAMAAVQAAYGLRPATPETWPAAPPAEPCPGPQDLADDDLGNGWTDRLLFNVITALKPGARAVLRHITDRKAPPPTTMSSSTSPTTPHTPSPSPGSAGH
ncbi:hypothetical protein AB0N31_26205 [Streptomyces sp. NPDC051051]|uniref:hypothetical protein n=1 Tax=Streptomyces sp. NPDC051051 TaxID=3155666 RepID=UPI003443F656